MILGSVQSQVVIDALDHGGGEFLGGEAVASAYHLGHAVGEGQRAVGLGVEEGLDDVLVERFSLGAGFLGAVQHAIFLTVAGRALTSSAAGNGRNRRTFSTPTLAFSRVIMASTVSSTASAPDPIRIMTRSASGAPV